LFFEMTGAGTERRKQAKKKAGEYNRFKEGSAAIAEEFTKNGNAAAVYKNRTRHSGQTFAH